MTGTSNAGRLRAALALGRLVTAPGASDPFTARIIQRAEFRAVYLGGNALGLSLGKGQPLLTLTETVDCASKVVRAVDIPVIVDAGAGFGGPAHAHRTVIEIESAGVAALHLDDQVYPKAFGYHRSGGGAALAPVDLAVGRLEAALNARRDSDLLIIARTDALRVSGSLDAAIDRGRIYAKVGVDALMILDLSPDHAPLVRKALPGVPLVWIGGVNPPVPNVSALEAAGFALALYPFNTIAAIAEAVTGLWTAVRSTGVVPQHEAVLKRMRNELQHIVGMQTYWDIEQRESK